MRREDGLSIISLIILIVILIIIGCVGIHYVFGENGLFNKMSEANNEYNKTEIVEKMNLIIKEKYVFDYKYALENKKDINEIYTNDAVIKYLLDNNYIEELKDINDNIVENQYFINPESLNSDLETIAIRKNGSNGNGTKVFKVKKMDEKYMIYFVDKYGEEEELGELVLKPEV